MRYKKFTVNVPLSYTDKIREVIGRLGGGKIGGYEYCSFSVRGTGRCMPEKESNPNYGEKQQLCSEEEEKIESFCATEDLGSIIEAIKSVHPYEEPAISAWDIDIF